MAAIKITVIDNFTAELAERLANTTDKAANEVAEQVRADTAPYTPFKNGVMEKGTKVVGNTIIYPPPYSRYLYYGKVMVDSATGRGAMHWVDKLGNEFIRFRKGAKLVPTDRPLHYNQDPHPKAGAFWFERSKADNLDKWIETARDALTNG